MQQNCKNTNKGHATEWQTIASNWNATYGRPVQIKGMQQYGRPMQQFQANSRKSNTADW